MRMKTQYLLDEKDNEFIDSNIDIFIVGVTLPNMSRLHHNLTEPTLYDTGGFRYPPDIPAYSPIDLSVALFEIYEKNLTHLHNINSLRKIFNSIKTFDSESYIYIYISINNEIVINTISAWKHIVKVHQKGKRILEVLKANAPFTFSK